MASTGRQVGKRVDGAEFECGLAVLLHVPQKTQTGCTMRISEFWIDFNPMYKTALAEHSFGSSCFAKPQQRFSCNTSSLGPFSNSTPFHAVY